MKNILFEGEFRRAVMDSFRPPARLPAFMRAAAAAPAHSPPVPRC